ncbi:hypothetical protein DID88_008917 [Monilinia fructigena]|uniref:Uncharacterized protein n=1 Tax=Monilinia fructigena TaxID=38457 RepID=A0A395J998_9HELO|nr:hypothetical protein DID88_008917 [Monilinia fructigena]
MTTYSAEVEIEIRCSSQQAISMRAFENRSMTAKWLRELKLFGSCQWNTKESRKQKRMSLLNPSRTPLIPSLF